MSATRWELQTALEIVGEYLTDNNAHFAREMMEFGSGLTEIGRKREVKLELVYRLGVEVLNQLDYKGHAPDFAHAIYLLQDYARTIGATPKASE